MPVARMYVLDAKNYLRDPVGVNQNLGPLPLSHFHRLLLLGRGGGGDLQQHVWQGRPTTNPNNKFIIRLDYMPHNRRRLDAE